MERCLLTRIGCRYVCSFCPSPRPYEVSDYDYAGNVRTMKQEIDSAPGDCDTFIISGCDCNEDLSLMFDLISRIRTRRNHATRIYIQSHCAAFQDRRVVEKLSACRVSRILVPVYGADVETHQTVMSPKPGIVETGFPQMEAIENCLETGIDVTARMVIANSNKDDNIRVIDKLMALAVRYNRAIECTITPVYYVEGRNDNYVPFKDLPPTLRKLHRHITGLADKERHLSCYFMGFPYCLFTGPDPSISNADFLENLLSEYTKAMGNQLPASAMLYSEVDPRIPRYRIRVQDPMCGECRYNDECAGFQRLDYEAFGIGSLRPYSPAP